MATLREAAARAEDLYYQDYAPRDKFIDTDDFAYQIAINYSSMLNALYQKVRAENKRDEGFSNVENSSYWLIEEVLPIEYSEDNKKFFVKTTNNIFSFDYDGTGNAVQGVCGTDEPHNRFRKISLLERRFYHILPLTNKVYYYLNNGNEIVFKGNIKKGTKITVQYIPQVTIDNDNCLLSDNIIGDVITKTLTLMFGAKNGNIIQEANDGNKNTVLQQQTNPQLNKAQTNPQLNKAQTA